MPPIHMPLFHQEMESNFCPLKGEGPVIHLSPVEYIRRVTAGLLQLKT